MWDVHARHSANLPEAERKKNTAVNSAGSQSGSEFAGEKYGFLGSFQRPKLAVYSWVLCTSWHHLGAGVQSPWRNTVRSRASHGVLSDTVPPLSQKGKRTALRPVRNVLACITVPSHYVRFRLAHRLRPVQHSGDTHVAPGASLADSSLRDVSLNHGRQPRVQLWPWRQGKFRGSRAMSGTTPRGQITDAGTAHLGTWTQFGVGGGFVRGASRSHLAC